MRSRKGILALILAFLMLFGLSTTALASSGDASGEAAASYNVDNIEGMLSLEQYVVENDGADSVSVRCFGVFSDEIVSDFSGRLAVYNDIALTTPAAGVTAEVADGVLTLSGIETDVNTVYYLSTGDGYYTVLYVVNDQYAESDPVTQELRDGTYVELSGYAPQNGSDVILAGNQHLNSVEDYTDLAGASDEELAAAAWWLAAGVTNGGNNLTTFGQTLRGFELSYFYYRYFQLLNNDSSILPDDFVTPTDVYLSMGDNDQFADPNMYTIKSSVWDGLYTQVGEDGYLYNIDGVTELGNFRPVSEETLLVSLYNAFVSPYSNLSEAGEAVKAALQESAGADPDNASKAAAVEDVLDFDYSEILENASSQKLAVIEVLNKLDGLTVPIPGTLKSTQLDASGDPVFVDATFDETEAANAAAVITEDTVYQDTDELISDTWSALFVRDGTLELINAPVTATGASANQSYPMGLGALVSAQGYGTLVKATATNGWPVLVGASGGTMAGGFYNGYGAAVNITNGIVYSPSQHPSNTVYNGTIHYDHSAVYGCGRQYSSDFWGGYIVFEDSVSVGAAVTDESTTVIYKNSYTNMASIGSSSGQIEVNGYGTMYFENSVIDNGSLRFQNNTSMLTDTSSLTLVNSIWNGASIGTIRRSEKAEIILVDSTLNLTTDTLLTASNYVSCSYEDLKADDELVSLYGIDAAIYVMGTVNVNTPDGTVDFAFTTEDDYSADSPADITLYVSQIIGQLDDSNIHVVYGDEYGTLVIGVNDVAAAASASGEASL